MTEWQVPECGSQDILGNARPRVELAVYENTDAFVFKGEKERYDLAAWICKDCGFTELYCL